MKGAEPPTDTVAVAWPVTVPVVSDVNVMVHLPAASVFGPAVVHVPVGAECVAPLVSVSVTSTCWPGERHEAGPVTEVLLEGHGEGVRHAHLVGGVRRDRDPRVDDLERLARPVEPVYVASPS